MKNKTLLKVLSASAIFTAIAAIESYDHNAFATEVAATATNNQSDVETKTVPQDVKNLPDGTYDIKSEAFKFYGKDGDPSMASAGLDKDNTKLIVKNGQYSVNVNFKPIDLFNQKGYLGDLKYYDGDKTHSNRYDIQDNEFKDTTIVENYSENEKDAFIDVYKKKFPGRTVYPKTLSYNVDKNKIDANNKLETYTQVFVPVMEAFPTGSGTQRMILEYNLNSLTTKTITEPKYNLVPLTMMDATANTKSMGDGAIDKSKTRVEKVGDTYHYYVTAKDLAFGPYVGELTNLTVNGTTATLTELGGSNHEKLYHFTSKEKYDVVNVTVDVDAGGRPFHKNTPARFAFDWAKATPLTKAIVNQLQNEEKAKANEKVATDKKAKEEKARIEAEKLAKEKAEKERIEAEKLAKEKAEKERLEREKPPVTAKGEPAIEEKPEFDLDGFISNHKGPITVKGEATILEKPEFDLDGYLREQKRLTEETTTTSDKKPLINDIFGQSEVKDTFVATPVSTKKSNVTTVNVKKSLANTGVNTATTGFFGLVTLLSAFILRRKTNK